MIDLSQCTRTYAHACVPLMNATRRKTRDEVGLLGEDSAARIKRTLTVVPNAPLDLYIPVPGCTFKGGNLIIIDYLRCQLWPINVFVFFVQEE